MHLCVLELLLLLLLLLLELELEPGAGAGAGAGSWSGSRELKREPGEDNLFKEKKYFLIKHAGRNSGFYGNQRKTRRRTSL